jgi:hypothetical protein
VTDPQFSPVDPQFWPPLKALLTHPDVENIYVNGTSPVMVETRDGRRIPAAELAPVSGPTDPGEPR